MTTFAESTITFPYQHSLGPVLGAFMTALTERRILGIRNGDEVMVPPMEWDPATGAELPPDFIEVGPAGTVESWTWVPAPTVQHPLDRPFAFALPLPEVAFFFPPPFALCFPLLLPFEAPFAPVFPGP